MQASCQMIRSKHCGHPFLYPDLDLDQIPLPLTSSLRAHRAVRSRAGCPAWTAGWAVPTSRQSQRHCRPASKPGPVKCNGGSRHDVAFGIWKATIQIPASQQYWSHLSYEATRSGCINEEHFQQLPHRVLQCDQVALLRGPIGDQKQAAQGTYIRRVKPLCRLSHLSLARAWRTFLQKVSSSGAMASLAGPAKALPCWARSSSPWAAATPCASAL